MHMDFLVLQRSRWPRKSFDQNAGRFKRTWPLKEEANGLWNSFEMRYDCRKVAMERT